jgi:hypothetical protein
MINSLYFLSNGYKITLGEVFRPEQMQKWYYDHGYAWTMNSQHMKKLAIDLNIFVKKTSTGCNVQMKYVLTYESDDLRKIGEYWKTLHSDNRWGGDWESSDAGHFEMRD